VQELNVVEGQFVKEGELLAVIDIEKSTIELFAEKGGKLTKLFVKEGDSVKPKDDFVEIDDKAIDVNTVNKESKGEEVKKQPEIINKPAPETKSVSKPLPPTTTINKTKSEPISPAANMPVPKMIVTDFISTTERTE